MMVKKENSQRYSTNHLAGITIVKTALLFLRPGKKQETRDINHTSGASLNKENRRDIMIKDFYLCANHGYCSWKGSIEPIEVCPVCGQKIYTTPCLVTGCSLFYKHGRDLRIRNTGISPMAGQESHIEDADLGDLVYFIKEIFQESEEPIEAVLKRVREDPFSTYNLFRNWPPENDKENE